MAPRQRGRGGLGDDREPRWWLSYTYRLCKSDSNVPEACFQSNVLKFAGETQWILYANGTKLAVPRTDVTEGTYPAGSVWARNPVPECLPCEPGSQPDGMHSYDVCGAPLDPVPYKGPLVAPLFPVSASEKAWDDQADCSVGCGVCNATGAQFVPTEGVPIGTFGFGGEWGWSLLDKVEVPMDIDPGSYLLSCRWDGEQSAQVWQNCADLLIIY